MIPLIMSSRSMGLARPAQRNEAVAVVNDVPTDLGSCDTSSFCDFLLLTPGTNEYTITVTDYAGNTSNQVLTITRTT